jgi:hypothetical protein
MRLDVEGTKAKAASTDWAASALVRKHTTALVVLRSTA